MKLAERTLTQFVEDLAGDAPAPGGGSVAAYAGAMSAALAAMVARLTVGKKRYQDAGERMAAVIAAADPLSARFVALLDADTAAYNQVVAAFKLPKSTEAEKAARSAAVQQAFKHAAEVPLETLETAARLVELLEAVVSAGNPNCITDAGTAVHLCRTCAHAAAYNVRINLGSIRDAAFVETCSRDMSRHLARVDAAVAQLEKTVDAKLSST